MRAKPAPEFLEIPEGATDSPSLCLGVSVVHSSASLRRRADWGGAGQKGGGYALRLGFRQIKGFSPEDAARLVAARGNSYADPLALWRRARIAPSALEVLAKADAFRSMALGRREAL